MVRVYATDNRDSALIQRYFQESGRSSSSQLSAPSYPESSRRPVIYHCESDSSDEYGDPQLDEELLLLEAAYHDPYRCLRSQGLRTALKKAEECKDHLRGRRSDQALATFVQACIHSSFCLALAEDFKQRLVKAIEEAESRSHYIFELSHNKIYAWAARCILSGYQEIGFPDCQQIRKIMNQPNLRYSASIPRMDELVWIAFSGRFRVCYIIAVQLMSGKPVRDANKEVLYDPDEFHGLTKQMVQDYRSMCEAHDETHPITVQTGVMLGELITSFGQFDPLRKMEGGFETALDLQDPAMAMHHVIFCMFEELKDCRGCPDEDVQRRMDAAAKVLLNQQKCLRSESWQKGSLWDVVKDRLLRSMMLLARTFDLASILTPDRGKEEHELVVLLNHEYAQLREQEMRAKLRKTPAKPPLLAENSVWSNSSKSEEEHEQRCERCNKRTRLLEQATCDKCNLTFYCSRDCMKKDSTNHRTKCKRLQLKQKHDTQQGPGKMSP